MKITVEISGEVSVLELTGIGEMILLEDILPRTMEGTPGLAEKTKSEALKQIVSGVLDTFIRQRAELWKPHITNAVPPEKEKE